MADEDDLPDADYESIYGREALDARLVARLRATEERLQALYEAFEARAQHSEEKPGETDGA